MTAVIPKHVGRLEALRLMQRGEQLLVRYGYTGVWADVAMLLPSEQRVAFAAVGKLRRQGWIKSDRMRGAYVWYELTHLGQPRPIPQPLSVQLKGVIA